MQSMWIYWLLVFFIGKSTGLADVQQVQVGALAPDTKSSGWTVIARRTNGELNFFRNWAEYKKGFGENTGDFFIGLDKLHAITKAQPQELYVYLEDFEGSTRYAKYDEFLIESEDELYRMSKLGNYTGDAGDSLVYSKNMKFSTYDRDNDRADFSCAVDRMGAWWYSLCAESNLFATYVHGYSTIMLQKGAYWVFWRGYSYSYNIIQMMLRPKFT